MSFVSAYTTVILSNTVTAQQASESTSIAAEFFIFFVQLIVTVPANNWLESLGSWICFIQNCTMVSIICLAFAYCSYSLFQKVFPKTPKLLI